MMAYIPALDQIQLGQETPTWGTSAAATSKLGLISDCSIDPEVDVEVLPDIRGSLAPGFVPVLNSHKANASLNGECSYDDLPYMLDSLLQVSTPGAATTYTRDYLGQLLTAPTRRWYTLYKGSAGKVQKMTGGVVNELGIKIDANKAWTYSAKLIGKAALDGALAALSDRSQTPIHANVTTMYIDLVGGTIGATLVTSILFSADISIKNGAELYAGVSSLTPLGYVDGPAEASVKVKMAVDADTAGYLTAVLGTSPLQKLIRFKATTGAAQIAQLDFGALLMGSPKINTDQDGVTTFEFEFNAIYNAALGNWMKASVTNSIATMV